MVSLISRDRDVHFQQGKPEGERKTGLWSSGLFVMKWCKRKRRAIFICGALLLVGAVGLVVCRRFLTNSVPSLCSFPSTISVPSNVSFPSTNLEEQRRPIDADQSNTLEAREALASRSQPLKPINVWITDDDCVRLEECLQSEDKGDWTEIINKNESTLEHRLLQRIPKTGGPMQYLSTTRYKYYNDTTQIRNFMTDNDYKLDTDSDVFKSFESLDVDTNTGIEVWHAVKEYPSIGRREYVLATKLWEREEDKTYYCVTKACHHPKAPVPKHTLITNYLSGWKISKAAKGGCEVKMFHQEDLHSPVTDILKGTFKRKFKNLLEEYVAKTAENLQHYIQQNRQPKEGLNAVTLTQKL